MAERTFLNFAYGSNLLTRRLLERAPSAVPLSAAVLPGHELRWHKVGRDGSGKCDVVAAADPTAAVHGALFEIACHEKPGLDAAEGLGAGYDERTVVVHSAAGPISCRIYVATDVDPSILPYDWYKALVLAGAREHRLPHPYLSMIERVQVRPDPDAARRVAHMRLLL